MSDTVSPFVAWDGHNEEVPGPGTLGWMRSGACFLSSLHYLQMLTLSLQTSFFTFLVGSEGKSEGSSEWKGSNPVSLHTVAWHGSSRVRPASPDLREEILSSPGARNGPCVGALQVGLTSFPISCLGSASEGAEQGAWALWIWATVALLLFCLIKKLSLPLKTGTNKTC